MKKFWKLENTVSSSDAELIIEGPISSESWWGDEATPEQLREELKNFAGKPLTVSLNSGGGDVFAGLAMYNALRELDSEVTIRVDGLAASIASIIAMAGDKVIMSPGSMMMIHKPSIFAAGDEKDLQRAIELLKTVEDSIVPIYTERTSLDSDKVVEMMEAETWMTAEQAVELGFADSVAQAKKKTSEPVENLFNQKLAFSMSATKEALDDFVKQVSLSEETTQEVIEDEPVVNETTAEDEVEAVADATVTDDSTEEVEKTTEEVVVTDNATPAITNSVEEKVEMTEQETIATEQVLTPSNQAPVASVKPTMEAYLKSKDSMEAFARVLEDQAGKTSEDVRAAWGEHLAVTMGVTNPEILLPTALITEIEDAFKEGGEIWNRVTKTGADVFRAAWDTQTDVNSNDGRARGYNRADEAEKQEQVLTIADRVLRPQFIYKYITLNKEDVKNQRSTGALVRYVLTELPRRIVREVERAIVIGDGRGGSDDYKIDSFVAIKADATANNVFAETYTPAGGESRYESLLMARDLIEASGSVYLISKKGYLTSLLLEQGVNGGFLFAPGTDLGRVLGFAGVIEPDWMTEDDDNDAYLVILANYKTVGDSTIEAFTNFILKTNKQEYLQEIWAGGGLTMRKSAVAIATTES